MNTASNMVIDLAPFMAWVVAAMTIINFAMLLKGLITSGEKKLELRVGEVEKTSAVHDRAIEGLKTDMKHLPDKDSVNKLQVDMADMKGQIASIAKTSEATERATRRVEEFLLRQQ